MDRVEHGHAEAGGARVSVGSGLLADDEPEFWFDNNGFRWKVLSNGSWRKRTSGVGAVRSYVFARDDFSCVYCGVVADNVYTERDGTLSPWVGDPFTCPSGMMMVTDHIISQRNGGSNHPCNLVTACCDCNRIKAATHDRRVTR